MGPNREQFNMHWLRLIRWSNLLIILLTQGLVWWCVLVPLQHAVGIKLLLTPLNFSLLCISTMLVAAAGYIINDYFDIRIDAINKPDKVILERQIPRRLAIIVHSAMNVLALLLAGIVAWQAHHPEWLLLQLFCTFILWRYSTTWKRQFMIGNVMVALMTALTVVVLMIYEPALNAWEIQPAIVYLSKLNFCPNPVYVMVFFAFFAFVLTWMREIVKDMEDFQGDDEEGCVTMPIQWGLLKSMRFVQLLSAIAVAALTYAGYRLLYIGSLVLSIYIFLALIIPLFIWMLYLPRKATTPHFSRASRYLKIIMVLGIGLLLLYRFQYG
jgi:4-hydroxybenzoate polyprenyltransferase